jgi:hypothetical protein
LFGEASSRGLASRISILPPGFSITPVHIRPGKVVRRSGMNMPCALKQAKMKAIWLALLLPLIGASHALGFFWLYGRGVDADGLLLVSWPGALLLYICALYCSTLFKINNLRGVKVALMSLLLSLVSGYIGTFLGFNTYGT